MDIKAKERIKALADRNGGRFDADQIIEDARHPQSPLHSYFDWDVERAAMQQWRQVAREMIRSVQVERVVEERTVKTVAYVRDPCKTGSEQGYVSVDVLRDEPANARQALLSEFSRAEAALRRALDVAKALGLESDVASLLRQIDITRIKASKGATA